MHLLDDFVIGLYLVALVAAGAWLARRAGQDTNHYFLGGRKLPWWALGCSGMASNLDVAGTMTIVTLVTLYGLHGFFIEFRGGVVLPIAVFVAFMGKWHQRSRVMTTAEWMILRFGKGAGGRAARLMAALTYVILTVAMIVFFLSAGGKFLAEFLPFTPQQCSVGVALVAFAYTLAGGLYGVIWTDVFQAALIGGAAIYVAMLATMQVSPELLASWPGARFNQMWPSAGDPGLAPYQAFPAFLAVWCFKGVLEGLGGSGGSAYMAQRFYAAGSERDAGRIGLLWTILFAARWPMVLGFAILAMRLGLEVHTMEQAELVLPRVLHSAFFPPGVRGAVIAAMLAAAMSTFDSTINAGASYVVRDFWEPLRPRASTRELVWVGYGASAALVGLAMVIALGLGGSVVGVWVGIVMLLFPSFLVPFALRWFWARFNGAGFAAGVAGGFLSALYFALAKPTGWNEATQFLAISAVSLLVSISVTLLTPAVDGPVLREFYTRIRPFGLWPAAWRELDREEHRVDRVALAAALVWQVITFLLPMGLMLRLWVQCAVAFVPWVLLGAWLWRRASRLPDEPADAEPAERAPARA